MPPSEMSADPPAIAEMREEFNAVLLEVLVPYEVQLRVPEVRGIWRDLLASKAGSEAADRVFLWTRRRRWSVFEATREAFAQGIPSVVRLREMLYHRMASDEHLIAKFVGRVVTNGNEQCPYWDRFAYADPPRPGMLLP